MLDFLVGTRFAGARVARLLVVTLSMLPAIAWAGPQHWGFGFSYLAAIEEAGGSRRLVVYEPPLRAKDGAWLSRWIDRTTVLTAVPAGGIAVGDFWPATITREYLTSITPIGSAIYMKVYEPPECFGVRGWTLKSTSAGITVTGTFLGAAAGNLQRTTKDQLLVAFQGATDVRVVLLTPPTSATGTTWTKGSEVTLPGLVGTYLGMACGDFWDDNQDYLAVATSVGGATRLSFYSYAGGAFTLVTTDAAPDLPALVPNGLCAADYEKDGFDALTLVTASGFEIRTAPARPGAAYNPGPEYTGRAFSGQTMPGNGGAGSSLVMRGNFSAAADNRIAFAAGRVFGYVNTDLNSRYSIATGADAQIAFARRSPRKDERSPYGWPAPGETVSYDIAVNNNGASAVSANLVRLKVWVNRATRNPDTDPLTCDAPDYDQLIDVSLPAYNSSSPTYITRTVSLTWPYSLVPAGEGATWQKLNVDAVGERWTVASLEYASDVNLRNNRYEIPLHGWTFHPIFRTQASLSDRQPTVSGDPPSKEYLARKLADAVQCMWERSSTRDGQDALRRLWFDSYEIGWPDDQSNPGQAWAVVQAKYEGWRELDGWWGVGQNWERFNWGDGGAELHETGHLFHPIGDLYQYYASPVFTGTASMADGTPAQIRTWVWPADSYGSGHTRITWPACEMMRRHLVGVRNNGIQNWESLAPDRTYVRVLDRDGQPVGGAEVTLWLYGGRTPFATGITGADGRWDLTSLWGTPTADVFGRKHYFQAANTGLVHTLAQVFTVKIGSNYQDCAIWGTDETAPHSRHTYMGHSFTDETGWTWDFRTNYRPGASAPSFKLTAAVQASTANLGVTGSAGGTFRVYRRWEPACSRTLVGDFTASGDTLTIPQNMAAADSFSSGRFRATYEVTEVTGTGESLPRMVQLTGVSGASGLSARSDGKLLLAANAGIANPFCQVFDGTTPYQELFYHFRFGHTASRVVASRLVSGKYYATLSYSDMTPDYRFDLVDPPTGTNGGYDVRNDISTLYARSFSTAAPFYIQCNSSTEAARYAAGDQVNGTSGSARVTQVSGDRIYTDALVFTAGQSSPGFSGYRLAGKPGSDSTLRELSSARGLDTIVSGGSEYIVIADTGNRRVAVWNDRTAYVTHWQSGDTSARPAAIAAHPTAAGKFFMIDRRTAGVSKLYLFTFDAGSLSVDAGYPVDVAVGDATDVTELGLAAATSPLTGDVVLLIIDARLNKVLEYSRVSGAWQNTAACTQAAGIYAGTVGLSRPTDVAYVAGSNGLRWYAVDGRNRVVLLGELSIATADNASAKTASNTAVDIPLHGTSGQGSPLAYIITSLPAHGGLRDPGAGEITAVPYVLVNGGQTVRYRPATGYTGADSFQFKVNDGRDSAPATVSITVGGAELIYSFPMDTAPPWTVQGDWAFGVPTGGGGQQGGPDPTSGHTGKNVFGYNLAGDYGWNLAEKHLTSRAINCSGISQVRLRFWRWLGVEAPAFDHAYVRVSRNATAWTTVWQNTAEVADTAWVQQDLDISSVADNQPALYLRWTMGTTDGGSQYCGWNIDDVEIWGSTPHPAMSVADFDWDGDVDGADFDLFAGCDSGPAIPPAAGCTAEDLDADGDVDDADFAAFQRCLGDSGALTDPACSL